MKILVIGASGFIGQHVVAQLRERNHAVTAVARRPELGIDHVFDITTVSVPALTPLLGGHDGVVFAAGVDDRAVPRPPAYPKFRRGNVDSVVTLLTAARLQGLSRAVVIGSYYTYFERHHPEWKLAATHPYIRSRVEQARAAREAADWGLPVAVLELPFVFGRTADRRPNWAGPLDAWVRSPSPLFAPDGGTAVTTATSVGQAAALALEHASGDDIPVVDENLTWRDMFGRIAVAAGRPRRVRRLPSAVARTALGLTGFGHAMTFRQSGLKPSAFAELLLRELYIEPAAARTRPLDAAIADTFAR